MWRFYRTSMLLKEGFEYSEKKSRMYVSTLPVYHKNLATPVKTEIWISIYFSFFGGSGKSSCRIHKCVHCYPEAQQLWVLKQNNHSAILVLYLCTHKGESARDTRNERTLGWVTIHQRRFDKLNLPAPVCSSTLLVAAIISFLVIH